MTKRQTLYFSLGLVALLYLSTMTACNTTRIVKPLKAKEAMVQLDFGGPLIDFAGAVIPLPFSSIMGAYGVDSNLTVFGGVNITSALYGNGHVDAGIVYRLHRSKKCYLPSISGGLSSQFIFDMDGKQPSFRAYPVVDVNLYWQYLKSGNNFVYLNFGSWIDLWEKAGGTYNDRAFNPTFALGHTFENAKMRYTIEAKYMLPGVESGGSPVVYNGINGYGSFGIYLGISRKF